MVTTAAAQTFGLMGAVATPLAEAGETGSAFEALALDLVPGAQSPLHTMSAFKMFYVAAGTVTLDIGGEQFEAATGSAHHVPVGAAHRYRNTSGGPARLLVVVAGRGQVEFLRGMSALTASRAPDRAAVVAHAKEFGVSLL
jgi:quercetin dioxygenase-like cupin family protein